MSGPDIVFAGARLRAVGTALDRGRIFVTFDHREKGKSTFPDYRPIARALDRGLGHLSISTAANDWFLSSETEALRVALRGFSAARSICAAGFSMGGYGAMLLAGDLRLERVMLFAPQYSIFPAHAPHDPRYASYAEALDPAMDRIPNAEGGGPPGVVVYDPRLQPMDRQHAFLACRHFPRLQPVALPFGGHPPLQNFAAGRGYAPLLTAFLEDRLTAATIRNLHREARQTSERYERRVSRYLRQRAGRGAGGRPPPPADRPRA